MGVVYVCLGHCLFATSFINREMADHSPSWSRLRAAEAEKGGGDDVQAVQAVQAAAECEKSQLVGGLEDFLFSHLLGIIIPIDIYFSEGLKPPTR